MSGDESGGGRRFGRGGGGGGRGGGFGGRGGGGGGYAGGRRSFDSDNQRNKFNDKRNSYEQEDDWDETPSGGDNYGSGKSYGGGGGGGSYGRNYDKNERLSDDDENKGNSSRGVGRGSNRFGGGRNYNNDDEHGNSRSGYGRGGGDRSGGGDGDSGNRRGGGRGMNRRGGGRTSDSNREENGYNSRKDNYDDDGENKGRRRSGGDRDADREGEKKDENKDEKPRERYIPPEPTDDEDVIFGSAITSGINFSKYENIRVKVTGENPTREIHSFNEAGLRDLILKNVKKSGYTIPTPIQKHALPAIMMGRDIMACAQTGSGKTAAFLLPIINTLLEHPADLVITSTSVEPQAVIMSPTRELTIQIFNEARKFAHGSILKIALVYGGTATFHQANTLMRGCHILVATPGRLNDFVSRGRVSFASIRFFVLDEADRMLDMGFKPEIEKMLLHESMVPVGQRQTMLFSATFPEDIQRMALDYLHNYLFIAVGIVGGACADVEQIFYEVSRYDKKEKLKEILSQAKDKEKTLVFVEQKRTADFIAALLSENGFPTTSIHGDRFQSQREIALNDFKSGRMPTLVATAVAARGLDIKNVGHVVNFDLPSTIEEYIHRIGRTGRVGNRGKATSFYDPSQDSALAGQLVTVLKQTDQPVPDFLSEGNYGKSDGIGFGDRDGEGFGGRDVRRGGSSRGGGGGGGYNTSNIPVAQEEAEEW
ncbi:hypothetical protein O3M35_009356 [Rhynocoris fuscipes]|uniref:RNA helicase n=1 Tax=Rhynocoris fuscipes TaxID=488301 RepID=A0AAW1D4X2_9HEMI